jgi:hypothetical protein
MNRFRQLAYKVSRNHTRTCWVLKCDIRKFFASIDQAILLDIVRGYIPDPRVLALIAEIVTSFSSDIPRFNLGTRRSTLPPIFATTVGKMGVGRRGLPLGNLTSQLLVNIYMNEFDQFVKHRLKMKYYVRYADDFVLLSHDRGQLERLLQRIQEFLAETLKLDLHPDKVFIQTFASGVDFLGWVHFPDHRVLRTSTKRRMLRNLNIKMNDAAKESYRGMLRHGNARKLQQTVSDEIMRT